MLKIRRECWLKNSSFARGAALLANVVGRGELAGTGGELVYGKGSSWVALHIAARRGELAPG